MKKKQTRVCDCGAPLVWTFLYDGAEYYCLNCGNDYGMLGAGKDVDRTIETRARQKVVKDVFKALRKHLWGSGRFQRTKCKKCKGDEYHTRHATKYEQEKVRVGEVILKHLQGFYSEKK